MIYIQVFLILLMIMSLYALSHNNKVYKFRTNTNKRWSYYGRLALDAMKPGNYSFETFRMLTQATNVFYEEYEKLPSYDTLMNFFKYTPKKLQQLEDEFEEILQKRFNDFKQLL